MKFIHEFKQKVASSKLITKLKSVKNVEIIIAVVLALVAAVTYFVIAAKGKSKVTSASLNSYKVEMTESEARLARTISDIAGVGEANVLISRSADGEIVGVVVVAKGANDMTNRVKMIRCIEKATGASVDKIEIFEMSNGG